ncbi:uncharacterized protein LOC132198717 [Neocloeon triangulifer]|uniref:uncharacterized protein LOC132198717 n=1 Tax=Neocloeon triangulifer TaxID=2078957 RepID=UPI00286F3988|nr:uncharacterized protein LOC132198717 [Neocloeon triangulifer]
MTVSYYSKLEEYCANQFHTIMFIGFYTGRKLVNNLYQELDEILLPESETELRQKIMNLKMEVNMKYYEQKINTSNIVIKENSITIFCNLPPDSLECPMGSPQWFVIRQVEVEPNNRSIIFNLQLSSSFDKQHQLETQDLSLTKPRNDSNADSSKGYSTNKSDNWLENSLS